MVILQGKNPLMSLLLQPSSLGKAAGTMARSTAEAAWQTLSGPEPESTGGRNLQTVLRACQGCHQASVNTCILNSWEGG